jgi:hypothetical protein
MSAAITFSTIELAGPFAERAPRQARSGAAAMRLTRRGRVAVLAIGLLVALAFGFLFASGSTATERGESTTTIQVTPGETLWDIAASVAVEGHTGEMVEHIKSINHLEGAALQVGQHLLVPLR